MPTIDTVVPDMTNTQDVAPALPAVHKYQIDMAKLSRAIEKCIQHFGKNREFIQQTLVGCCAVAFDVEHHKKNVSPFTTLVKGLRGADQKALIGWIEANAPAIWRMDESSKTRRFVFNNSYKGVFDYDKLMGEKWWDYARPANEVSSTIDFREQLDNLVKRLTREATAEGANKKTVEHPEVLVELKALQGRLSATEY